MCFRSCFVDFFFIFGCCVFAGAPTSLLAAASSSSSHANMAPATPRIDASPPVSLSVGSMALLANLQRDLQVYSARLTALEEQNRSLKDAVLQIQLSSSALIVTAPQKEHSLLGTGTALFRKMSEQAAASSGKSSVKDFYFLLQATGLLPSPEALFATLLLKNGMASLDCISGDAGKLNEECSVFYELQPDKKKNAVSVHRGRRSTQIKWLVDLVAAERERRADLVAAELERRAKLPKPSTVPVNVMESSDTVKEISEWDLPYLLSQPLLQFAFSLVRGRVAEAYGGEPTVLSVDSFAFGVHCVFEQQKAPKSAVSLSLSSPLS